MATCLTLNNEVLTKCRNASAGVVEIYLANYSSVSAITYNVGGTLVETIGGTIESGYTSGFFYKFLLNRENANFKDEAQINLPNGTRVFKPTLSFKLAGLTEDNIETFKELAEATVIAMAKTLDGKYYLIGRSNGLDLSTGSALDSGMAAGDFQGATLNLEGLESTPMIQINPTAITTYLNSAWHVTV